MFAIADPYRLHLLDFEDSKSLSREVRRLHAIHQAIVPGINAPLQQIQQELKDYFEGHIDVFQTPFTLTGTVFQQSVWIALQQIPYGETCSYKVLADKIGKPGAYRAVANANGANALAIIIPCHRVIQRDGQLGGYDSGVERKSWLIAHEHRHLNGRQSRITRPRAVAERVAAWD
jgi:AraC family transcriptional regulator of adaptative response/methylated-DNA-[protein]-cysteine methyltransferase